MNPVEKAMVDRSSHVKLAVAMAVLVLVLWVIGSAAPALWMTPVIVFVLWLAIQVALRYRRGHHRT